MSEANAIQTKTNKIQKRQANAKQALANINLATVTNQWLRKYFLARKKRIVEDLRKAEREEAEQAEKEEAEKAKEAKAIVVHWRQLLVVNLQILVVNLLRMMNMTMKMSFLIILTFPSLMIVKKLNLNSMWTPTYSIKSNTPFALFLC